MGQKNTASTHQPWETLHDNRHAPCASTRAGDSTCQSQEDLAQRAGISRPTVSRIERGVGDVGIDVVQRIADALGVAVSDLFVPPRSGRVDDDELARRAADPADEFIDVRALLTAVDEAAGAPLDEQRYSRAGRPPVAR